MGIKGLLNVYDPITKKTIRDFGEYIQWKDLKGKTLIIDALGLMISDVNAKPIYYDEGPKDSENGRYSAHKRATHERIEIFKRFNISTIWIFDFYTTGYVNVRGEDVISTFFFMEEIKEVLDECKVPHFTSPSYKVYGKSIEAEWFASVFVQKGLGDYILSKDTDLFLFGQPCILINSKKEKDGSYFKPIPEDKRYVKYIPEDIYNKLNITKEQMVEMCLALGKDDYPKVEDIGVKKVLTLIRKGNLISLKDKDLILLKKSLLTDLYLYNPDTENIHPSLLCNTFNTIANSIDNLSSKKTFIIKPKIQPKEYLNKIIKKNTEGQSVSYTPHDVKPINKNGGLVQMVFPSVSPKDSTSGEDDFKKYSESSSLQLNTGDAVGRRHPSAGEDSAMHRIFDIRRIRTLEKREDENTTNLQIRSISHLPIQFQKALDNMLMLSNARKAVEQGNLNDPSVLKFKDSLKITVSETFGSHSDSVKQNLDLYNKQIDLLTGEIQSKDFSNKIIFNKNNCIIDIIFPVEYRDIYKIIEERYSHCSITVYDLVKIVCYFFNNQDNSEVNKILNMLFLKEYLPTYSKTQLQKHSLYHKYKSFYFNKWKIRNKLDALVSFKHSSEFKILQNKSSDLDSLEYNKQLKEKILKYFNLVKNTEGNDSKNEPLGALHSSVQEIKDKKVKFNI